MYCTSTATPLKKNESVYGRCVCAFYIYGYHRDIVVHLSGCPVNYIQDYIDYEKLPWYKKLFTKSPRDLYSEITLLTS